MKESIRVNEVNTALAAIETNLETIYGKISSISEASSILADAWSSVNATTVKGYVTKMEEDLSKLYTSVERIRGNVQMVTNAIEAADDVTINGGGATGPGAFNQSPSQFSQTSMR